VIVDEPGGRRPDREIYLVFHDVYADDVPNLDGDVDRFNGGAFLGNTDVSRPRRRAHSLVGGYVVTE